VSDIHLSLASEILPFKSDAKKPRCDRCDEPFARQRSTGRFCSASCRKKAHYHNGKTRSHIETIVRGTNADLIKKVARLYLPAGSIVADVTYGRGVFWRKIDLTKVRLIASDLHFWERRQLDLLPADHRRVQADFTSLPYADESIDRLVLDPPYLHAPGNGRFVERCYRNKQTTPGLDHDGVIALYRSGLIEARRVLRRSGGQAWVKCQDTISGGQRWSHIEIKDIAEELGFFMRDLFILVPSSTMPRNNWKRQVHARKAHSYLSIFETKR
jgi:hypothetical protein